MPIGGEALSYRMQILYYLSGGNTRLNAFRDKRTDATREITYDIIVKPNELFNRETRGKLVPYNRISRVEYVGYRIFIGFKTPTIVDLIDQYCNTGKM